MAESSLSLGWTDFKKEVGFLLGYGSTAGNWSSAQTTEIEDLVNAGYRRVLYPFHLPQAAGYEWSFLHPTTTLSLSADDFDYNLPDDFGRIVGEFHYAADQHRAPIKVIPEAILLDMRSTSDYNDYPEWAAIRFKSSTGSTGQRQEALFYPEPHTSITLSYSYDAYPTKMSSSAPYPLGGMEMSEVYKEACLAAAEVRNGDQYGLHNQLFERLLLNAIQRDKKRGAQVYGHMGQPHASSEEVFRRGAALHTDGAYSFTYNGIHY